MPKCKICGKDLANPNSSGHIASKFHQDALKNSSEEVAEVKKVAVETPEVKETKHSMPITPSPTANPISKKDYNKVVKKGLFSKIKNKFKK